MTDRERKSGEKQIITVPCNYYNNKLFTSCDQFILGNETKGKDGNCGPKNNANTIDVTAKVCVC